jgi:tetrahydromethanopterin S-methyltransferase subunit C
MNPESTEKDLHQGHWFLELLMKFAPEPEEVVVTGTPAEMIKEAAKKTFWVSTTLSAVPGPFGLATILPEIGAVTKVQLNLVYKIAKYYKHLETINQSIVLLIFANALGLTVGNQIVRRVGMRLIVKVLSTPLIERTAQMIGLRIAAGITKRIAGRWLLVVAAPVFGLFSRKMTQKIGAEAMALFAEAIELEETKVNEQ